MLSLALEKMARGKVLSTRRQVKSNMRGVDMVQRRMQRFAQQRHHALIVVFACAWIKEAMGTLDVSFQDLF